MNVFQVRVSKLTNEDLMRRACSMTFSGTSKQSLLNMYKSEHSPCRTQMFWIECMNIPLFVSTHLIRHHVGSQPYQLTCRDDRNGGNIGLDEKVEAIKRRVEDLVHGEEDFIASQKETLYNEIMEELNDIQQNTDRNTPVNLGILVNAQSLIDMAKQRECFQSHATTRKVFTEIKRQVEKFDPELSLMMVKKCVYRGGICGESKGCGYNCTESFKKELDYYLSYFISPIQKGAIAMKI